jgi:hypothetical protein
LEARLSIQPTFCGQDRILRGRAAIISRHSNRRDTNMAMRAPRRNGKPWLSDPSFRYRLAHMVPPRI